MKVILTFFLFFRIVSCLYGADPVSNINFETRLNRYKEEIKVAGQSANARQQFLKLIKESSQPAYRQYAMKAYQTLANYYSTQSNPELAIQNGKKAIELARAENLTEEAAGLLGFIGQQYGLLGLDERGRKEIFKGIAMLENVRTDDGFLYLGHLYSYLQYIKEPRPDSNLIYLGYARKALGAYHQILDSTKRASYRMIGYGNLGMSLLYVGQYDGALAALDSVLDINQGKIKYISGNAYMNKGEVYRQLKQIDSAEVSLKRAEEYFKDQGFLSEEKILFNTLANLYQSEGDSANMHRYRAAAMATDNKVVRSNLSATTKLPKSDQLETSNLLNAYNGIGIFAGLALVVLTLILFFFATIPYKTKKGFHGISGDLAVGTGSESCRGRWGKQRGIL